MFRKIVVRGIPITFSTLLTFFRIILIPFIVISIIFSWFQAAFFLFVAASVTDVLDGFIARWRNECTEFGAFLDPIADKLLMVSCLVTFAYIRPIGITVPWWLITIIVCKEMVLVTGFMLLRTIRNSVYIKPTWLGKSAMVAQVLFVGWLCICCYVQWVPEKMLYRMSMLVACLSTASLVHYIIIGWRQLKIKKIYMVKK